MPGRTEVRARLAFVGLTALVLASCGEKTSEFFAPATGGPILDVPAAADLDGRWDISYTVDFTSCEPSLEDFMGPADIETDPGTTAGSPLRIWFPDAPVPIAGFYDEDTGDYEGSTGPVDVGSGAFADEMYMIRFRTTTSGDYVFSGESMVPVTSGSTELCRREFSVDGIRVGPTPD